ncbi:MAG: hypothetical protein K8L99_33390 [Anaerolineae bacterium]|nr:hypothetical protein [Anaerolineae bacterium]
MFENIKVNVYGLFGFVLLAIMLMIRMLQVEIPDDVSSSPLVYRLGNALFDPYILASIIPYVIISFFVGTRLNSMAYVSQRLSKQQRLRYQRFYIGTQIAFILAIVGLLLGLGNLLWRMLYYVIVVAVGFLIAFFVVSPADDSKKSKQTSDELEF